MNNIELKIVMIIEFLLIVNKVTMKKITHKQVVNNH
jgi:hypothetical protein